MNITMTTNGMPDESNSYYDYNEDKYFPCILESAKNSGGGFLSSLYSVVFLFGLPGNILVLWILLKYKQLWSMTNIYLLNLAISDLLFVISLPFWAYFAENQWIFGDTCCKIINTFYVLGYYGEIMFISLISIDRYFAIVYAMISNKMRSALNGLISSIAIWFIAILASLPTLIYTQTNLLDGRIICHPFLSEWTYFIIFKENVLGFLIPLIIMLFCYIRIVITLLKNKSNKKHRAIKVVFIVVIVFFICWTPHNIIQLLISLKELNVLSGCDIMIRLSFAQKITESITFVHCCLNPIIYAFLGQNFRSYLHRIFYLPSVFRSKASHEFTTSVHSKSSGDHQSSRLI
ncbi:C-C chemokine receptor type 4-like [Narcine bancroftii]|uniref:C-C chemokine receptor type 4-like n=1 Tax=Narcine bancroftii TaxID=1343680 RepID=UPI00383183B6